MHLKSQSTEAEATLPRLTDDFICPSYKIIYVYWKSGFARITPESDFDAFMKKFKIKISQIFILRKIIFVMPTLKILNI